jgi:hypothetical protein
MTIRDIYRMRRLGPLPGIASAKKKNEDACFDFRSSKSEYDVLHSGIQM